MERKDIIGDTATLRMKRSLLILAFLSLLAACSKDNAADSTGSTVKKAMMRINSQTRSLDAPSDQFPVFLFWLEEDYPSIGESDVYPYHVAFPQKDIDSYNVDAGTYNTGKYYPESQSVYATGYSPASIGPAESEENASRTTLTVPHSLQGKLDVMVAEKCITGSSTMHFEKKLPPDPMRFIHAQGKVSFKALLTEEMGRYYYLRNVSVSVKGEGQFLHSLRWDGSRYVAESISSTAAPVILTDPDTDQMDPAEIEPRSIGSVYLYPGLSSVTFSVDAELGYDPQFKESKPISTGEMTVGFTEDDGVTPVLLDENEEYEIELRFNYDAILITGKKADYKEGGLIIIPVYPNK